ncbi:glucose-6-phosphatase 3 isoform X1 [Zonotrichia leucophrys gambelii]|uniref:glucose-6-phosphatase 3 isoform X1 n=1 Tax=Zonotrichia leucophrys gambelii TaxID=257770 RepID=UPI0031402CEF
MEPPPQEPVPQPSAMDALHQAGIHAAVALQAGPPWLEQFWLLLSSYLGPGSIYTVCFPLARGLDEHVSLMVLWIALLAEWLNVVLKWFLFGERPYWWMHESGMAEREQLPLRQFPITCETGPGSPSGHCMILGAALWPVVTALSEEVSRCSRSRLLRLLPFLLYLLLLAAMGLSRIFVLAHFPHQVISGSLAGSLLPADGSGAAAERAGPARAGHGRGAGPGLVPPPGQHPLLGPRVAAARDAALGLAVPGGRQRAGAGRGRLAPLEPPRRRGAVAAGAAAGQRRAGGAGARRAAQAAQERPHRPVVPERGGSIRAGARAGGDPAAPAHPHPAAAPRDPLEPPSVSGRGGVCSRFILTCSKDPRIEWGVSALFPVHPHPPFPPGTFKMSGGSPLLCQFILTFHFLQDPQIEWGVPTPVPVHPHPPFPPRTPKLSGGVCSVPSSSPPSLSSRDLQIEWGVPTPVPVHSHTPSPQTEHCPSSCSPSPAPGTPLTPGRGP